jgi:hypothetical protein
MSEKQIKQGKLKKSKIACEIENAVAERISGKL